MFMSGVTPCGGCLVSWETGVTFITIDPIIRPDAAAREGCRRVERGL